MLSDLIIPSQESTSNYQKLDSSLPFSEYITQCQKLISERRLDLKQKKGDPKQIIDANSPYELHPTHFTNQSEKCGVILIHGLWDSPFTLKEIAIRLQNNGILCRGILLPGHGTRPTDLQKTCYQDWIDTVRYAVDSLQQQVEKVYLIGYSAGATLSIYQALSQQNIAGLVALAPAIRINPLVDLIFNWHYFTKWLSRRSTWIYVEEENDYAKYRSIGFNPAFQIFKLTQALKKRYKHQSLTCPLLMVASEDDETISASAAMQFFKKTTSTHNQFILYSTKHKKKDDNRIELRNSAYPQLNIKNFSHVALPFSPENTHYGMHGDYSNASHPADHVIYGAYNRVTERFYNQFQHLGLSNNYKRELTYNPDFDFLADKIVTFIKHN